MSVVVEAFWSENYRARVMVADFSKATAQNFLLNEEDMCCLMQLLAKALLSPTLLEVSESCLLECGIWVRLSSDEEGSGVVFASTSVFDFRLYMPQIAVLLDQLCAIEERRLDI